MQKFKGELTVGELKKKLEKLPDDMVVLTGSRDHSYRSVNAGEEIALYKDCYWGEYGDEPLERGEEIVKVLVIK